MAKTCVGCAYYRPLYDNRGESYCNYILDTGEPRGCPAENCKKKISMEEYMKRVTQEQKQEIIRLRIEGNVPVKAIAEKFHLSKSAVFNIISKWKEYGDSAISEEEIRNELHNHTINEAANDGHVCYELTADTDIDAYMSDTNVKEPDTVAAVSDSEQEIVCDNIPADIVSQETDIVKPVIPYGVREACRVRLEYLKDLIAEEQAVIDNWTAELKEIEDFLEENKEDVGNG